MGLKAVGKAPGGGGGELQNMGPSGGRGEERIPTLEGSRACPTKPFRAGTS